MKKTTHRFIFLGMFGLFVILMTASIMSCSSSDSENQPVQGQIGDKPNVPANTNKINVEVSDYVNNIQLTAGKQTEVSFVYKLSPSAGTFDSITVKLQETLDSSAVNIVGTWTGTYTCENTGCSGAVDEPTLIITKDQDGYHYSSGNAYYDGYLCGNTFKHEGKGPGYTEKGTFILESANSASKTSSWVADDGSCSGNCTDQLTRI